MKTLENIRESQRLNISSQSHDGMRGTIFHSSFGKRAMVFVASWGGGWEHVSVSFTNRCPTWDEMCLVKNIFWAENELVVQYHPPKEQYVNCHPYCLHLWKPIGLDIPVPPRVMVGP